MALKEALENILNNTNLVKEFGNNARTYIEKEFDIRKQIIKTESLYKRLI
jgi:glycosyltransferase involved in cell wall biosynthesis